ncbi:unnamed protein product [Macrosiphum euphorbiae]|uniref:Uncharacterized protein n=1 Tax=Macrosiphum euphorbiae TaxID=13131 RepID=A0AAV0VWV7_9HEMI|nr:unnamed protein product [Macrosiphum euphorbiae]
MGEPDMSNGQILKSYGKKLTELSPDGVCMLGFEPVLCLNILVIHRFVSDVCRSKLKSFWLPALLSNEIRILQFSKDLALIATY